MFEIFILHKYPLLNCKAVITFLPSNRKVCISRKELFAHKTNKELLLFLNQIWPGS